MLVFLQHPAQQVQLLADAMDPQIGGPQGCRQSTRRARSSAARSLPVGQELHRGERTGEALAAAART